MPDLLGGFSYTWPFYATALIAYLVGSVPFGLVLTRLAGLGDIRAIGSGNIGATNVMRTGRKGLAVLTLVLDAAKGGLAVSIAGYYGPDYSSVAALAVVVGHLFPIWLRFRGGKGVATALGVLFALAWPIAVLVCLTWLMIFLVTRYSSLAAMIAVPAAPAYLHVLLMLQRDQILPYWLPGEPQFVTILILIAVMVVLRHHANILRLVRGEEPKFSRDKT